MLRIRTKGSLSRTEKFLTMLKSGDIFDDLDRYGREGVVALARATPVDTGLTSQSWDYTVSYAKGTYSIEWFNTNVNNGANVAILLQYGHGTGTGGFVRGQDYINPAIQPVMDKIADNVWKKVKNG